MKSLAFFFPSAFSHRTMPKWTCFTILLHQVLRLV